PRGMTTSGSPHARRCARPAAMMICPPIYSRASNCRPVIIPRHLQPKDLSMPVMTGLSGNEMYCLHLKGLSPGELVIGNSVFSMGLFGSLAAAGRGFLGGEVPQITSVIHEGRLQAYRRMVHEAARFGAVGITGVTNTLRTF